MSRPDPRQQILIYQRQLNRHRAENNYDPRDATYQELRKQPGLKAKLLALTFDFWYPLKTSFGSNKQFIGTNTQPRPHAPGQPILTQLDLENADLANLNLAGFDLIGLNLRGANLQKTTLSEADLSWADLSNADLQQANLCRAHFFEANLTNTDLTGANVTGTNFSGAKYNASTRWPSGFNPQSVGAELVK